MKTALVGMKGRFAATVTRASPSAGRPGPQGLTGCATITVSTLCRRLYFVGPSFAQKTEQDKIHDAIEHGAESVYSHKQMVLAVLLVVLAAVVVWSGWTIYHDRQTAAASIALDSAMKAFSERIGTATDPAEITDVSYANEAARATDALAKFTIVADKYPRTAPGRRAP